MIRFIRQWRAKKRKRKEWEVALDCLVWERIELSLAKLKLTTKKENARVIQVLGQPMVFPLLMSRDPERELRIATQADAAAIELEQGYRDKCDSEDAAAIDRIIHGGAVPISFRLLQTHLKREDREDGSFVFSSPLPCPVCGKRECPGVHIQV
jgi:hypothetical protein